MKMDKQDIAALLFCAIALLIILPMIVGGAP